MATTKSNLTATGTVALTTTPGDNRGMVTLSGTYGTVQGTVQGYDGNSWINLLTLNIGTNQQSSSTLSPADNSTTAFISDIGLFSQVRFNCSAIASGTVTIHIASGYVQAPFLLQPQPIIGFSGATNITSSSATAFTVGPNGTTNPSFLVDASTASAATGLKVKSAAAAGGLALSVISSGGAENLTVDALGTGTIGIGTVSTGAITLGAATTVSADLTLSTHNLITDTSTGTKIGTATTQKIALWNATPIVQPANTVDYVTGLVNVGLRASGGTASATFPGAVTGLSFLAGSPTTGGLGYATGAGGAVTQASSRTTTVVLSKLAGAITLVSAAGSATPFTFTVTNTTVAATDTIIVSQQSGTDAYSAVVSTVGAGSFKLTITDLNGTTTEQPVFNFSVIKSVAS